MSIVRHKLLISNHLHWHLAVPRRWLFGLVIFPVLRMAGYAGIQLAPLVHAIATASATPYYSSAIRLTHYNLQIAPQVLHSPFADRDALAVASISPQYSEIVTMAHDRWNPWPQPQPKKRAQSRVPLGTGVFQAMAWTVERLVAMCRLHSLSYEERSGYDELLGAVLTVAGSTRISLKPSLPEAVKVYAIAYALGRLALGSNNGKGSICYLDRSIANGLAVYHHIPVQERAIHVWAAHLLVLPVAYQDALRDADNDEALAEQFTAGRLNIPVHAVVLWQAHRDWTFSEDPMEWLGRASQARGAKEGVTM